MIDPRSAAAGLADGPSHDNGLGDAATETIALLQEEIARLEDELRLRDAELAERTTLAAGPVEAGHEGAAQQRIDTLVAELAAREETILLLLEQIRLAEEAEAASRAEWEQLNHWVQAVERRVEERDTSGTDLRAELEAERRNSATLRQAAEKDQQAWDVSRKALIAEVERLRSRFTQVVGESDAAIAAVQALEHENQQLRDAYDTIARNAVPTHEMDAIVQELQEVRKERDALTQELQRQRDDRQRQQREYEAGLNALKSQMARESLRQNEGQVRTAAGLPPGRDPLLEADERIRALREHLKEIQHDESEQRMRRSLASRLSRLWHHTSPQP
jgi:ribosomal protein S15P/S13E